MWLRVSTKGEYGVRIMVDLARHYIDRPRSLTDISLAEQLPLAYLEQLVKLLREAEPSLVTSTRGAHGGYRLSRDPATISMGEIVRVLEGPLDPMICATEGEMTQICTLLDSCKTKQLWAMVRDAVAQTLDALTLADLVGAPDQEPLACVVNGPANNTEMTRPLAGSGKQADTTNPASRSQFIALSDIRVANSAT